MNSNDMAIDVNALLTERHNLDKRISELDRFASALKHNITVVSRDFTSANFERAAEIVDRVLKQLHDAANRMQSARVYLNGLEDKVEKYLNCKYNG